MHRQSSPLKGLLNEFTDPRSSCTLETFKEEAMLLARTGADLTDQDDRLRSRNTLLHHLVANNKDGINDNEIIELLTLNIKLIKVLNGSLLTPLQLLLDIHYYSRGRDRNYFKHTAMLLARHGANLTDQDSSIVSGNTLLHYLVTNNTDGVNDAEITELLELNKNILNTRNNYKHTPLQQLVNSNNSTKNVVRTGMILARQGAGLNVTPGTKDITLLHYLVLKNGYPGNNYDEQIKELLDANKELIHLKDGAGRTALQALLCDNRNVSWKDIDKMLGYGSHLHTKDDNGETLLHSACSAGKLDIADKLVRAGLDIQARNTNQQTMLHRAVHLSSANMWEWLLLKGVDINAKDIFGYTALHCAAGMNNFAMAEWLIDRNAEYDLRDEALSPIKRILPAKAPINLPENEVTSKLPEGLLSAIQDMHNYGEHLINAGSSKGQIAVDLATQLRMAAENADNINQTINITQFMTLLNSKNQEMAQYRTSWSTILTNIAIALTGIGALIITGKLLYSRYTEGRALFFCQKNKTTCEEKIEAVRRIIAI